MAAARLEHRLVRARVDALRRPERQRCLVGEIGRPERPRRPLCLDRAGARCHPPMEGRPRWAEGTRHRPPPRRHLLPAGDDQLRSGRLWHQAMPHHLRGVPGRAAGAVRRQDDHRLATLPGQDSRRHAPRSSGRQVVLPVAVRRRPAADSRSPSQRRSGRSLSPGIPVRGSGHPGLWPGGRQHPQSGRLDGIQGRNPQRWRLCVLDVLWRPERALRHSRHGWPNGARRRRWNAGSAAEPSRHRVLGHAALEPRRLGAADPRGTRTEVAEHQGRRAHLRGLCLERRYRLEAGRYRAGQAGG